MFVSNLYGVQNPFNLNRAEGNESSSLVSEISNMSILVSNEKYLNDQQLLFPGTGSSFL